MFFVAMPRVAGETSFGVIYSTGIPLMNAGSERH
jgi:hypothetical protein